VESQRLKVSHAFHSPLMEPMLDAFEAELQSVRFSPPRIGLVSNVTGRLAGEEVCTAAYWRRHVMAPVRFMESIGTLQHEGYRLHVEIGPTPILLGMAQRCEVAGDSSWVPSLRKACDEQVSMLQSAGELHVRGVPLRWTGIMGERARHRRASLPAYPFQKQRYWEDFEPVVRRAEVASTGTGHPLLGEALESPLHIFQGRIGVAVQPWLADHRILDLTLLPAAGFLELALAGARHAVGPRVRLRDMVIREGLPLPDEASVVTQVIATPTEGAAWKIEVLVEASEDPVNLSACTPVPWQGSGGLLRRRSTWLASRQQVIQWTWPAISMAQGGGRGLRPGLSRDPADGARR
jgi:acyl transferase domain-containing protein